MPHLIVSKEKMEKIKKFLSKELPQDTAFMLMVCEGNKDEPLAQYVGNTDRYGAIKLADGLKNALNNGGIIRTPDSN